MKTYMKKLAFDCNSALNLASGASRAKYRLSAAAILSLATFCSPCSAAPLISNGDFSQCGPPVVMNGPGAESGSSAAKYWSQFKVVPGSTMSTNCVSTGLFFYALHINTNAGAWPPASMGNGVIQGFPAPATCVKATYSIRVDRGQITGGLVKTANYFQDLTPINAAPLTWRNRTQVGSSVGSFGFENLVQGGIADFYIANVQVSELPPLSCRTIPLKDLSQYVAIDRFYDLKNPAGPIEQIRITNSSTKTLNGPFHVLLKNMDQGRMLLNSDGDLLGTPFITLNWQTLEPWQTVDLTLRFNPADSGGAPNFTLKLMAGNI